MNWWIQSSGGDWFMRVLASRWVNLLTIFYLMSLLGEDGNFQRCLKKVDGLVHVLGGHVLSQILPYFPHFLNSVRWMSPFLSFSTMMSWLIMVQNTASWMPVDWNLPSVLIAVMRNWLLQLLSESLPPTPNSYSTPSQRKLVVYTSWNKTQGRW